MENIKDIYIAGYGASSIKTGLGYILSSRLSSRTMGWSMIGEDEMARMRTFRENGGNISNYCSLIRLEKKKKSGIKKKDKNTIQKQKKICFGSFDPDKMLQMLHIAKLEFKWLKAFLRYTG